MQSSSENRVRDNPLQENIFFNMTKGKDYNRVRNKGQRVGGPMRTILFSETPP